MNKTLFFLLCLLALNPLTAHATEEQDNGPISLATLEGEPSSIVHGCVSVITGDYVESQVDLVIPGLDPLIIQRSYVSHPITDRSMGHGWSLNHHGFLDVEYIKPDYQDEPGETNAIMTDENGSSMIFHCESEVKAKHKLRPNAKAMRMGVTNSARGVISAKTNWDNTRINYYHSSYHACTGSGAHYIFEKKKHDTAQKDVHRLLGIEKPNGTQIAYDYEKKYLSQITWKNRADEGISWATIQREEFNHHNHIKITANDGNEVQYNFSDENHKPKLTVLGTRIPRQTYTYADDSKKGKIERKDLPEDRYRKIDYYEKGHNKVCFQDLKIKYSQDKRVNRVKTILEPVGIDSTPVASYQFIYELHPVYEDGMSTHKGETKVYDAQYHQTIYLYNGDHRLTQVDKYKGNHDYILYSSEKLFWGKNDSQDKTRLISRTLENANGHILFNRYFVYDKYGNIIKDILSGNISGIHPKSVIIDNDGIPSPKNYQYTKSYTYSEGMNLMLTETDGFCMNEYAYHHGTDLLAAQYLKDLSADGAIRKRSFFEYDTSGALTLQIEDDGQEKDRNNLQGVTERKITTIKNTPTGLPRVIEEKYFDFATKQEKLLHQTVNEYDLKGNLKEQSHYDANKVCVYKLSWDYDQFGNVIKETDALGHTTTYKYDQNGNKIHEQGPNPDYYIKYDYDYANRLIHEEIVCSDMSRFAKGYTYDTCNRLVSSTDIYGNTTYYEYDEFGRQTGTRYPSFADENGKRVLLKVKKQYDLMGNVIEQHDACGAITKTAYTIQGKPYRIEHPDGTVEHNEYGIRGNLIQATAKNGTITKYTYDYQSRPLTKTVFDANNTKLHTTFYKYNALHLLKETDPEGIVTKYRYDGAGRVSEILKGNRKTTYVYDSLGRLIETQEHDGDTILINIQEYDLLNRVIEERTEDQNGQVFSKINYEYDLDGNKCKTSTENQAGTQVTTIRYNVHNQPIETINASDQLEVHEYDYNHCDSLGKFVSKCTTTDISGNQTITIKDAMAHVVSVEVKNPYGQTIQSHKNFYNAQGRKARHVETVYTPGNKSREVVTCWKYDIMGHVTDIIEAAGTSEQKQTHNDYNKFGQLESIVKPNGSMIQHRYDAEERLIEHFATDGTFHYRITYDCKGNPRIVEDLIHSTSTIRKFSPHNQILEETLGNDLTLRYSYDNIGRLTQVTLPDHTQIEYTYDPYRLKKVERFGVNGIPLYAHVYEVYDPLGSLMEATMIGQAGTLKQNKDILNRIVSIQAPHWQETIEKYDLSGNPLTTKIKNVAQGTEQHEYTYDELHQLQSEQGHEYRFDSLYNRVAKDGKENKINDLNQLINDGQIQYTYDRNGRLERKFVAGLDVLYTYDALDRLLTITEGNLRTSYVYDADHRRLSKTIWIHDSQRQWTEQSTVRYLYQGKNEIGAIDSQGSILQLRVLGFGQGAEIGAAVAIECRNKVYAPVHDHNGSVVSLVDSATGLVEEEYKYTAFGEEQIFDNQGQPKVSSDNPWRYASKRIDEESGFIYFGRRYYDSHVGRWITPDPIGYDGGPNLYAYIFNCPLSYCDLYGLFAQQNSVGGGRQTFFEKMCHFFGSGFSKARSYAGSFIRWIGDDVLPIPVVKDAVSIFGHVFGGGRPSEYQSDLGTSSQNRCLNACNGEISPNVRVMYINGMCTPFNSCVDGPLSISLHLGGFNVHLTHNSSHGFVMDLLESVAQIFGIPTHSVNMAVKQIRNQIETVGGVGGGGKVVIMAHSQGGLITKRALEQLSPDELRMLDVVTFGSAALINNSNLNYCVNYVSTRDLIPLAADPWGYFKGMFSQNSNVVFLKSNALFFEHDFGCDTYQKALREECERIIHHYSQRK